MEPTMLWPFNHFRKPRLTPRGTIDVIYGMIVTQAREPLFYRDLGVPDTVNGRFDLIVLGTPSTVATLNGEVFYYISQRTSRPVMFMNQKVIDQRVIAVYFDKNRQVVRLANYGLKDGKIFDFISRTTATSGQEMSYLTPLFKLLSFH